MMNRDEYRDFFNKNRKKVGYPQLTEEQLDRLIELSEKKENGRISSRRA